MGAPDPVPALLLGRPAVDRPHASRGVGTALAAHVPATAVALNERAACRAVTTTQTRDCDSEHGDGRLAGSSPAKGLALAAGAYLALNTSTFAMCPGAAASRSSQVINGASSDSASATKAAS